MRLDPLGRELVEAAACSRLSSVKAAADTRRHLTAACRAYARTQGAGELDVEREIERAVEKRRCRTASGS